MSDFSISSVSEGVPLVTYRPRLNPSLLPSSARRNADREPQSLCEERNHDICRHDLCIGFKIYAEFMS